MGFRKECFGSEDHASVRLLVKDALSGTRLSGEKVHCSAGFMATWMALFSIMYKIVLAAANFTFLIKAADDVRPNPAYMAGPACKCFAHPQASYITMVILNIQHFLMDHRSLLNDPVLDLRCGSLACTCRHVLHPFRRIPGYNIMYWLQL